MRYTVLEPLMVKKQGREIELQPGQIITLLKDKAMRLVNKGKIKPWCHWLKNTVDDCDIPCFEIEAARVIHECRHLKKGRN